jgi:hypothetical protein
MMLNADHATIAEIADTLHITTTDALAVLDRALDILGSAGSTEDQFQRYLQTSDFRHRLRKARGLAGPQSTLAKLAEIVALPVDYLGSAFVHALARSVQTGTMH